MIIEELVIETSPFTPEEVNKIVNNNERLIRRFELIDFYDSLYEDVSECDKESFIEEFCEFLNAFIISYRGLVFYKQKMRDKCVVWCENIGRALGVAEELVNAQIKDKLCIPFMEDLTCRVLKELHSREGISKADLSRKLGVHEKTVYNEIEKIKGTKGTARIYGQQIQMKVNEDYVSGDIDKSYIKKYHTKNTVHPVMLQMNISQTATMLSALAKAYLNEGKNIAWTLGFEIWGQLSKYGRERIETVYSTRDEDLITFIGELSMELEKMPLMTFQTELEAFSDLYYDEQLLVACKTGHKCDITMFVDGMRETYTDCIVKEDRKERKYYFEQKKTNGEKEMIEYDPDVDIICEIIPK